MVKLDQIEDIRLIEDDEEVIFHRPDEDSPTIKRLRGFGLTTHKDAPEAEESKSWHPLVFEAPRGLITANEYARYDNIGAFELSNEVEDIE